MGRNVRVLVADDDRRMVKTISDILEMKGYETVQAYSGTEAVEMVTVGGLDCVLMDVDMPGLDGVAALRRIREIAPALPVVLMSAFTTAEQVTEAERLGAYSVLTKPIELQWVLSFISSLRDEMSILVVDDDPEFSGALKLVLQASGYRVETEADPEKVLGHMAEDSGQVVVLDLRLGNVSGLELLKEIRTRYPTKPVLLATGYGRELSPAIEEGLQIGAYTCLYKPFKVDALVGVLEEIGRRKLRALLGEPSGAGG